MACEVCEHCHGAVSHHDGYVMQKGYSYHKECHKCYVCSETNLRDAEVFKGVIFCSSCSQRIFQGCSTARRAKTSNRQRDSGSKARNKRRDRRTVDRQRRVQGDDNRQNSIVDTLDGNLNTGSFAIRVIERARMAASSYLNCKSSDRLKTMHSRDDKAAMSAELALQAGKKIYDDNNYEGFNKGTYSAEIGMTTDVTQELLRQMDCPVPNETKVKPPTAAKVKTHKRKRDSSPRKKPVCSDLRIAELGASTEIANMALRKQSDGPFAIKSEMRLKPFDSINAAVLNHEDSVSKDSHEWLDSAYCTLKEEPERWMERRFGSIIKMPYYFFKRNVLERSSLVSILLSADNEDRITLVRKLREIFREEIVEHRSRGMKRLYPTINRRKVPYKLGWLQLMAKLSAMNQSKDALKTYKHYKRCHHYKGSHSYRCMRAHVMRLAGPTKSELAGFRVKMKKLLLPSFLFKMLLRHKKYPALMSQGCGNSDVA